MADTEEGPDDDFYERFADELEVLAELGGGCCCGAVSGTADGGGRREGAGRSRALRGGQRSRLCPPYRASPPVIGTAV